MPPQGVFRNPFERPQNQPNIRFPYTLDKKVVSAGSNGATRDYMVRFALNKDGSAGLEIRAGRPHETVIFYGTIADIGTLYFYANGAEFEKLYEANKSDSELPPRKNLDGVEGLVGPTKTLTPQKLSTIINNDPDLKRYIEKVPEFREQVFSIVA